MPQGCILPRVSYSLVMQASSPGEVEAEKEHLRAVDARPIKKVAEAKARKRKRLQVRLWQLCLVYRVRWVTSAHWPFDS